MTQETIKKSLATIFEPRGEGLEGVCFRSAVMNRESAVYPIYEAVSNAQYASGLTHDFSYEIASRAVDILAELEDWDNEDALAEMIDGAIPVYTNDLMKIYENNSAAVDEAVTDMGTDGDSTARAQAGWYVSLRDMVAGIKENLSELID